MAATTLVAVNTVTTIEWPSVWWRVTACLYVHWRGAPAGKIAPAITDDFNGLKVYPLQFWLSKTFYWQSSGIISLGIFVT